METHEIPGLFSESVKIYYYPSITPSKKVLFVLKGIYGEHIPGGSSWDNKLAALSSDKYHVILVNTSRLKGKLGHEYEAFAGKTFQQECDEVSNAFEYCDKIFSGGFSWGCVGVSFGGTTFLGMPQVLSRMETVVMIGSGCGKSSTTTKPLISSLLDTEQLLFSLDTYSGAFIFLHGANDTVVPKESQRMIYDRAIKHSTKHEWVDLPNLDHSLRNPNTGESRMAEIACRYIKENF